MWILVAVLFEVVLDNSEGTAETNINRLPRVTELDNYEECLSAQDGLYCLGTFLIHPNVNATEKYDFIKQYSAHRLHYDRTRINRGYCVGSRCPPNSNIYRRFENCVQTRSLQEGLNTTLGTLHYCRTPKRWTMDFSSQTFLVVVLVIFVGNVVGAVYDVKFGDGCGKRKSFWTSWSIRSNWKQLVEPFGNDPNTIALAPIQVMRVVLLAIVIMTHLVSIRGESFLQNPEWFEKLLETPMKAVLAKTTPVVQIFFTLSSFLTAYNLLLVSRKKNIGLWMLPKQLLKRYIRIAPVHLLFVWFATVIWPHISDGPMWHARVIAESTVCRRKFWAHLLHVQNIYEPAQYCLLPTWSLGVDLQMQLIALILTLTLAQSKLPKFKILSALFICSCALNASLAYLYRWKPLLHIVDGKTLMDTLRSKKTYLAHYYFAPWGSLPSCLIGLFLAHLYFKLRQESIKLNEVKWFCILARLALPAAVLWVAAGCFIEDLDSGILSALYVSMERPMFVALPCLWLFGMISGVEMYPGFKALSSRIWLVLGKLSLSVLLVHWVIIETYLSSQPQPIFTSWLNLIMDFVATWCLSYILALPITLFIEMPIINTYNYITSYKKIQKED